MEWIDGCVWVKRLRLPFLVYDTRFSPFCRSDDDGGAVLEPREGGPQ